MLVSKEEYFMDYSTYIYRTPAYAKESMNKPGACPEFAQEAAKIITRYVRKYKPSILPCSLSECYIRDLLSYEDMLKRKLEPAVRDYWIKVYLLIREQDDDYERDVLKLDDYTLQ